MSDLAGSIAQAYAAREGARQQSSASRRAAAIYAQVTREQIAAQKAMFDKTEANLTPWREAGTQAVNRLSELTMAGPGEFTEGPGYQFRVSEGQKGIERSAAARGNVLSGATMKGIERFRQDYATNEYDNFLNRYYNSLVPYQNLSASGQNAAAQIGNFGANSVNAQSQIALGGAEYAGSSIINQAAYNAAGLQQHANVIASHEQQTFQNALAAYSAWKGGSVGSKAGGGSSDWSGGGMFTNSTGYF